MEGKVTRWFGKLGYGFTKVEDGTEEYFIHQTDILMEGFRHLDRGDKVEFDVAVNEKNGRIKAVNVKKIS